MHGKLQSQWKNTTVCGGDGVSDERRGDEGPTFVTETDVDEVLLFAFKRGGNASGACGELE